jgi:lipoate synthase
MERLASDYELTKEHRNQTVRDIRANYQEAIANLRNNSNKRQKVTTKTGLT